MKRKGFTLIELVIVILVIGLMFAIIIPIIQNVIQTSKAQKIESSFENLVRYIQTNTVLTEGNVQYTLINGTISPDIDYTGEMEGSGTITVGSDGNAEVQVQVGKDNKNEYCVYKSPQASKVKVEKGRCEELSLLDNELILVKGLVTNHSITVFTQFTGGATEYYYQINNGEWVSNENLSTNVYTFDGLNHNTSYEIKTKIKTKDGLEAVSNPLLVTTANVYTPTIDYKTNEKEKIAYIEFTTIEEGYTYRYKVDDGNWIPTTEPLINIRLNKNNTSFIAEVLDSEGNSMTSANKTIDYKKDTKDIVLTTREQKNGSVTDKYFNINYQARDEYFTYRYKIDNGNYVMPTEVNPEALITKNNSAILVEVVDPAGEVMRTDSLTSAYMDDTCYTVTLSGGNANGAIASNKTCAKVGDSVTITTTPSTGYHLGSLTYNGTNITSTKSFTMPRSNVTVAVTWAKTPYTITVKNTTGGTFSVNKTTAYYGDTITVTTTPAANYALSTLTYNGINITGTKRFTMPAGNVTVTGSWRITTITKYRTRSWISKKCQGPWSSHIVCSCGGHFVCEGACGCGVDQQQPYKGYGCGEVDAGGYTQVDCSEWGDWGAWTTKACSGSSTVQCESKTCLASSPSGQCYTP